MTMRQPKLMNCSSVSAKVKTVRAPFAGRMPAGEPTELATHGSRAGGGRRIRWRAGRRRPIPRPRCANRSTDLTQSIGGRFRLAGRAERERSGSVLGRSSSCMSQFAASLGLVVVNNNFITARWLEVFRTESEGPGPRRDPLSQAQAKGPWPAPSRAGDPACIPPPDPRRTPGCNHHGQPSGAHAAHTDPAPRTRQPAHRHLSKAVRQPHENAGIPANTGIPACHTA